MSSNSGYTPCMTWRSRVLWFFLGVVFSAASYSAFRLYQVAQIFLHDPYYVEHTAGYVIDYMKSHNNRWPTSWDDLYLANPERVKFNMFPKFEELKANVSIDWNARPEILEKAKFNDNDNQPAFRVIWLRNGSSIYRASTEPNRLIWDYLQKNKELLPKHQPE